MYEFGIFDTQVRFQKILFLIRPLFKTVQKFEREIESARQTPTYRNGNDTFRSSETNEKIDAMASSKQLQARPFL